MQLAPDQLVTIYNSYRQEYNIVVNNLIEFSASLIGYTILFRRGKIQMVLAEVIGAKGTTLTIRNIDTNSTYFVDITKTEIIKIGNI